MRAAFPVTLTLALAAPAHAASTWYVDAAATSPGDGSPGTPYATIQAAVDATATLEGDTILVLPGTYVENVDYGGKGLRVESTAGPLATFLQPAGAGAVVEMDTFACRLVGFTVRGAQAGAPGVHVLFGSWGRIERCILTANDGPGFLLDYDGELFESTISGNGVGVEFTTEAILIAFHSIVWGNTSDFVSTSQHLSDITYCLIPPPTGGSGNLAGDPSFHDAPGGDFHLRASSIARDSGDPSFSDPDGSVMDLGALTYDPAWAPGTSAYCFGSAGACPCGNGGDGLGGCDLPQGTGGVRLGIADFDPDGSGGGTAAFLGGGYPVAGTPGVTLIRSTAAETPPVAFGDGLRCIGTANFTRVTASLAAGGSSLHPVMHGAGAGTYYYQLWTRSAPAMFCTPEAFNLSNAIEVTWP